MSSTFADNILEIKDGTQDAVKGLENIDKQLEKIRQDAMHVSSELARGFQSVTSAINGTKTSSVTLGSAIAGSLTKTLLVVGGIKTAFNAVKSTVASTVEAGAVAENIAVKLSAAWETSKDRIKLTRNELNALTEDLAKRAAMDDEELKDLAATLLSFDRIGKNNFLRTLPLALNVATRSSESLKNITQSLGRALQDPEHNVGALTAKSLSFSEATKDAAKNLAKQGDIMGSQNAILAELESRYGGGFEAAANTFTASQNRITIAVNELQEAVSKDVLPSLTDLSNGVATAIDSLTIFAPFIGDAVKHLVDFGVSAANASAKFLGFASSLEAFQQLLRTLYVGIKNFGNSFELAYLYAADFFYAIKDGFEDFGSMVVTIGSSVYENFKILFTNILNFAQQATYNLVTNFYNAIQVITDPFGDTEFNWKPISEGFRAEMMKMPEIAASEMSDARREIQAEINRITDVFAADVDRANNFDFKIKPNGEVPQINPLETNVPPNPGKQTKAKKKKEKRSESIDLASFYTKLQTAALSSTSAEKKAAIESEKHLKDSLAAQKELVKLMVKQPGLFASTVATAIGSKTAANVAAIKIIGDQLTDLVKKVGTLPARAG